MTPSLLHSVLRVADARSSDADLLARFVQSRDELAFEELVRRHGPLVWSVCRQLLAHHADAEDAFQAVFLALIQGAGKIRAGQALSAWLHGVAVRVVGKVKRTSGRRRQRESKAAVVEADRPIPDATWAALMAAVHEEVQRLPEAERTAFILCELEGVRQPDAAARLGWPLGTLSARLSKARQRLIDRLSRRGIVPGILAIGGLAGSASAVPQTLVEKVLSFPSAPADGVSLAAALLARGLIGGATMRTKIFAAAFLLAGVLGISGSSMILSNAKARQEPPAQGGGSGSSGQGQPGTKIATLGDPNQGGQPGAGGGSNQAEGGKKAVGKQTAGQPDAAQSGGGAGVGAPPGVAGAARGGGGGGGGIAGVLAANWDYKFIDLKKEDRETFEKEIKQAGSEGWEYCGSERLPKANEGMQLVLVFKKRQGGEIFGGGMGGFGGLAPGGTFGGFTGLGGFGGGAMRGPGGGLGPPGPGMGPGGMPPGKAGGSVTNSSQGIHVLKLQHAKAEGMASVLQKIFSTVEITPEPRTNQLIVRANSEQLKEVEKLLKELDLNVPSNSPK